MAGANNYGYLLENPSSNVNNLTHNYAFDNMYGFYLPTTSSTFNLLSNIAFHNSYGFYMYSTANNYLYNNTALNNTKQGFSLLGYDSIDNKLENNYAAYNTLGGYFLSNLKNRNTLINNTAESNSYGFRFKTANKTILINNTAFNNTGNGFTLSDASLSLLKLNKAYNNSVGISLTGISVSNYLGGNSIIQNSLKNAEDSSVMTADQYNTWVANTYGDYDIGDYYVIPGSALSIDFQPQHDDSDSDRDGMPDWYEILYNLQVHVNDSQDDIDNDGLSNIQEYYASKNPNVPDSALVVNTTTTTLPQETMTELVNTTITKTETIPGSEETVTATITTTYANGTVETITVTKTTSETSSNSQSQTASQTAGGFGILFVTLGFISVLILRRKEP